MSIAVLPCREVVDCWHVEAIDLDGEGACYVTCFTGPGSRERASEYATWKYGRT